MKYYCEDASAVLKDVDSSESGLSSDEARIRLERDGRNELAAEKKDSLLKRFFAQMADPMIIILIVAAAISAVTGIYEEGIRGITDTVIILIVVLVNAILGVYQESKAEKAIEALQAMSAATSKVLRDGKITIVPSAELVVGDIVHLEAGDAVPADGRIIDSASLQIEEAALTGESVPVYKFIDIIDLKDSADVPLGDRKNMCYMGSTVTYGRGTMEYDAQVDGVKILSHLDGDLARLLRFREGLWSHSGKFEVVCLPQQAEFVRSFLGDRVGVRQIRIETVEETLQESM